MPRIATRQSISLVVLVLAAGPVFAWPWDPATFDECILKEMKGQALAQRDVVESTCRARFPVLPTVARGAKSFELNCRLDAANMHFNVKLTEQWLETDWGGFTLRERNATRIRGVAAGLQLRKDWLEGSDIVLYPLYGTGTFLKRGGSPRVISDSINFTCQE